MVLSDPEASGVMISNITGLGAEEASIYTTDLASIDGALYNSSRLPQREINITVLPLTTDDGSVEQHRLEIYKFFPIKQKITLVFETETRLAEITGYVKTNQPEIFSNQSSVSITVVCPDPYFYDIKKYQGITSVIFTSLYKRFQFKYKNDTSDIPDRIIETYGAKYAFTQPYSEDITSTEDRYWNVGANFPTLVNDDIVLFNPTQSAGSHKTYLKFDNNDNNYEVLTEEGADFTSDWDDGRFSDNNTSDDYLVLKFSDDRFYITDSFNKDEHLDWWKHTKFAEYADNIEQLIKYEGDVQIGVQILIDVFSDLRDFSIVNIDERTFMKIDDIKVYELTGDYLKRGDQIEISTVKGHKYIILKRNGITYSLLNCIDRDSEWFQLNVGDNIYTYLANDTSIVSVTMKYRTALIGI